MSFQCLASHLILPSSSCVCSKNWCRNSFCQEPSWMSWIHLCITRCITSFTSHDWSFIAHTVTPTYFSDGATQEPLRLLHSFVVPLQHTGNSSILWPEKRQTIKKFYVVYQLKNFTTNHISLQKTKARGLTLTRCLNSKLRTGFEHTTCVLDMRTGWSACLLICTLSPVFPNWHSVNTSPLRKRMGTKTSQSFCKN